MPDPEVFDNAVQNRFELKSGTETAFLVYSKLHDRIRLIHTEVPVKLRGVGVGSKLVEGALRLADQAGLKVNPQCPFVVEFLKRHPEYLHVVDPEHRRDLE
jgi:predicted GNAT family acetyltransferase